MSQEASAVQETPNTATTTEAQQQQQQTQAPPPEKTAVVDASNQQQKTPEEIKYDLKLKDEDLIEKTRVSEIEAYAKANKLTNEQAQRLLDGELSAVSKYKERQLNNLETITENWRQDVINDKELGGENFNKSVEFAHRALNQFGNETLKEQLNKTGLGNHPELVRMFAKIGQAMADDKIIKSGSLSAPKKSMEEVFYGGTTKD